MPKLRSLRRRARRIEFWARDAFAKIFNIPRDSMLITAGACKGADVWVAEDYADKYPFAIEVKSRKVVDFDETVKQAKRNAKKLNRVPLILLQNRMETWVAMPIGLFQLLIQNNTEQITREKIKQNRRSLPKLSEATLNHKKGGRGKRKQP